MKTYTLFWLTGDTQLVKGADIATAMNCAGIGHGALPALDFWGEGDKTKNYAWDKDKNKWVWNDVLRCNDCGWTGTVDDVTIRLYPSGKADDSQCPTCESPI